MQTTDNPRTFSFQPSDNVRKLVNLAMQLKFPLDRSGVINEALAKSLPGMIEESADARVKEIAQLVTDFRSDHCALNEPGPGSSVPTIPARDIAAKHAPQAVPGHARKSR